MTRDVVLEENVDEQVYTEFARHFAQKTGIRISGQKQGAANDYLLWRRRRLLTWQQYGADLWGTEKAQPPVSEMLAMVTTPTDVFFRSRPQFDFFRDVVVPDILEQKKRRNERRLRGWSMACATGAESYSLVMVLLSALGAGEPWDFRLLASDTTRRVLQIAGQGVYSRQQLKDASADDLEKYFEPLPDVPPTLAGAVPTQLSAIHPRAGDDDRRFFTVKPFVKKFLSFELINLRTATFSFQGKFDFVFCRKVLVYLDRAAQLELVKRLSRYLNEGGYLLIGQEEARPDVAGTGLKEVAPTVFKKLS